MTTTLIKTNSPSSKMGYFTGMESLSFKMVSILFIVILNITSLSAQTNDPNCQTQTFIYPTVTFQAQTKSVIVKHHPKVYTVYIAKTFPTLQASASHALVAMSDTELFDYEQMFTDSTHIRHHKSSKNNSVATAKSSKKNAKNKVAPKLNS